MLAKRISHILTNVDRVKKKISIVVIPMGFIYSTVGALTRYKKERLLRLKLAHFWRKILFRDIVHC